VRVSPSRHRWISPVRKGWWDCVRCCCRGCSSSYQLRSGSALPAGSGRGAGTMVTNTTWGLTRHPVRSTLRPSKLDSQSAQPVHPGFASERRTNDGGDPPRLARRPLRAGQ
jgi:hypothetical protein